MLRFERFVRGALTSGRRDAEAAARRTDRIEVGWKGLIRSTLPVALALGVSAALVGGARLYHGAQEARLEKVVLTLTESRTRFRSIDDEERMIEDLLPRFRRLEADGIIGPETRLDWVETLRAASQRLGLPELRYALGAQERLPGGGDPDRAGFGVYRSLMDLHLDLLHEEDLIRLFAWMGRESPGLFSVTKCRILRAGDQFAHLPAVANLRAACTLEWLSLRR